ncbi:MULTISPECIES: glycosyl hydrolase family 8 [Rhizobium]|uniref:cellulase n=1 Tax=Rhizobium rhododendri TaxID=2506430 RepID=A0ABY8IG48_9HYPH|nr:MULTISPECIES: glycosyl hydrolase family 8 [Rhizobium]MBZ5762675.1 glycosyl hydrolase family 5 [Rhizobium sp. VS19-DR96]MBZ5768641.1 glycosyl hydrolase family 5 [Rhizobium sp. VS19-DR129.2]MBZ5776155.1 glycosyl hydrolase family 5 [Rhizobium sp. VS19-DRK62.2]MBZ5787405.1 glycosyl hydrolase family 5 [Rhizobium sp. VS19-DR121]MBZ5804693.1 glycosyl hydrolase family 5 [Rhizobium sp. VS19-DR181]
MVKAKLLVRSLLIVGTLAGSAGISHGQDEGLIADDLVTGSWLLYRSDYITPEGRVIDTRAGGVSHSEGQGYGMLIAASTGDRRMFDRMWNWTKANLYVRGDGLAAWRWDPNATPRVTDGNNATDGDLLIGWALARAAQKWQDAAYARDAKAVAEAISSRLVIETSFGKALLPGSKGFGANEQPDGPVVNLSYWVYPAIKELGDLSAGFPATQLIATGLSLTRMARFGPAELPSDWISLKGRTPQPAAGYAAQFGQDAIRVPMYVAWFSRDYPDILEKFNAAFEQRSGGKPAVIDLDTADPVAVLPDPGYRAVVDLVACSLGAEKTAVHAAAFQPTDYYPSTLHLLSLIALAERYPRCLPDLQ